MRVRRKNNKKPNLLLFFLPESDIQLILTESCLAWQRQLGVGHALHPQSSPPSLQKALFIDDITEVRGGGSSGRPAEQRWNRAWHAAQPFVPPSLTPPPPPPPLLLHLFLFFFPPRPSSPSFKPACFLPLPLLLRTVSLP